MHRLFGERHTYFYLLFEKGNLSLRQFYFYVIFYFLNRNKAQLTKLQALQSRWHESTESEMNSSSETTVQWQPVQVGGHLPTPEVLNLLICLQFFMFYSMSLK